MKMKKVPLLLRLLLLGLCLTQLLEISAIAAVNRKIVAIQDIEIVTDAAGVKRKLTEEEKKAIRAITDAGAMTAPSGIFSPGKTVSIRDSLWAQWTQAGRPVPKGKNPFEGCIKKGEEKYLPMYFWAYNNKLLLYGEDVKKAGGKLQFTDLSREQSRIDMIEDMYREWCIDFPEVTASEKPTEDVKLGMGGKSRVYADALAWALAEGIVKKSELKTKKDGLYFEPGSPVTRAQASLWLYRFRARMEVRKAESKKA